MYETNDIELKWKNLRQYLGEPQRVTEDQAYTHEEIQLLLSAASLRERWRIKAIVFTMASSGICNSDLGLSEMGLYDQLKEMVKLLHLRRSSTLEMMMNTLPTYHQRRSTYFRQNVYL